MSEPAYGETPDETWDQFFDNAWEHDPEQWLPLDMRTPAPRLVETAEVIDAVRLIWESAIADWSRTQALEYKQEPPF